MIDLSNISTEELQQILQQRNAAASTQMSLEMHLENMSAATKQIISSASSMNTIPQSQKTELIDLAINDLLQMNR